MNPRSAVGKGVESEHRHTRDERAIFGSAAFTGRKLTKASTPKGDRPGHVPVAAGSGTPAQPTAPAHDPRRAATCPMQRHVAYGGTIRHANARGHRHGVTSRPSVARTVPTSVKPHGPADVAGAWVHNGHATACRAKETTTSAQGRSGIVRRWRRRAARRGERALKGTRTSREASGRACLPPQSAASLARR